MTLFSPVIRFSALAPTLFLSLSMARIASGEASSMQAVEYQQANAPAFNLENVKGKRYEMLVPDLLLVQMFAPDQQLLW